MRSYGQYCALAKALDAVGDRWALLIVRELLIRGACRYADLREGLPGIATNLLAARLKDLEGAGVLEKREVAPPIATALYALTRRGAALKDIVRLLGRWGAPLLADSPKSDEFRPHWLALPFAELLRDGRPDEPPVRIRLEIGGRLAMVEAASGSVRVTPFTTEQPDAVMEGTARQVIGVFTGHLSLKKARGAGLKYKGDKRALSRFQPSTA